MPGESRSSRGVNRRVTIKLGTHTTVEIRTRTNSQRVMAEAAKTDIMEKACVGCDQAKAVTAFYAHARAMPFPAS